VVDLQAAMAITGRTKLAAVSARLEGRATLEGLPMSVDGQVQWLIEQATDPGNLAHMFRGWAPWL
jgi:serine/threonine-protein kinase ATR